MHRKRLIVIILGLIISGVSGWAMFRIPGVMEESRQVLVITKKIEAYEGFSDSNVNIVNIPSRYVLPGAVSSPQELIGKIATMPMYEGEQITAPKIGQGIIVPLKEERYLLIPTKGISMKPGQKVDIYYAYEHGRSSYTGVEKILSDKTVAAVLDETGHDIYSGKNQGIKAVQAGIEVLVTHEEIQDYLEKGKYSKTTIVKQRELN